MKKMITLFTAGIALLCISLASSVNANNTGSYGVSGALMLNDESLTLEKMLRFAIEDEYLARGEYQKLMEKFGTQRPFSNIIKAETRHISLLKPLFTKYNFTLPPDKGLELAEIPETLTEAFEIGVKAEIANIEMYERFLKKDLPGDVREVFQRLLAGSKHHLEAFKKGRRLR